MEANQFSIFSRHRVAATSPVLILLLTSALVVSALIYLALVLSPNARRPNRRTVQVYCAAGFAEPVELAIDAFNATGSATIELARAAGSGELAGQIQTEFETGLQGGADVFISADATLIEQAEKTGVVSSAAAIAIQKPVIAVAVDRPVLVKDLPTLVSRSDIKFGVASENAAVGKLTRDIARRDGVLDQLEQRKRLDAENVMTLAQALVTGSLDAAVIWDTTVNQINRQFQKPVLKIGALADSQDNSQSRITLGIISTSDQPDASQEFARFLTSSEVGEKYFSAIGYDISNPRSKLTEQRESQTKDELP